ncbi:hypothetical protein Tco_0075147 [Tanacetum coccineum]
MSNILPVGSPPSSKEENLQDEIAKIFNPSLEAAFRRWPVPCTCSTSISPCPKEDGDYLCTNVMEAWPELRKTGRFLGPTEAGLSEELSCLRI